uniref:Ribosomal protein S1 n=2 Tax=Butomus umbellatus TaxID=50236 RepID=R4IQP6_BUTUM|nr:ribosomal protein S1 [Butomus umbellatus]AFY16554.1 ribosomal protein S1 [Butomus umbellatus]
MFLVDAGLGTPRICMQNEPTGVAINRATRFENKVGSHHVGNGQSERRATGLNDFFGSLDVVAGEPLLLPRKFRLFRAWMELKKIWRTKKKVQGLILDKVKGGSSVAIAGFITFIPWSSLNKKRRDNYRFTIQSLHPKRKNIVVLLEDQTRQGGSGTCCAFHSLRRANEAKKTSTRKSSFRLVGLT